MIYLKTKQSPASGDKAIFIQNNSLPMENGASEGQKTFLYNNVAFPLKDFPENTVPKAGDKCLFVRDKNLCIPVYNKEVIRFPEEGLIFYASLSEEKSTAETGQTFVKYGKILFQTENGIPCVYIGDGDYYELESENLPFGGADRTLSCWVKFESNTFTISEEIFGFGNSNGASSTFYLGTDEPGIYKVFGAQGTTISTDAVYDLTKWHHVAATYSNGVHAVFVDGQAANIHGQYTRDTKDGPIRIGAYDYSYPHFSGFVAACRLYNRVLSADEISLLAGEFTPNQEV